MPNRLLAVWSAVVLLTASTPFPAIAQGVAPLRLEIEELAARPFANDQAREINISFRIVNRGSNQSGPARATIVPGASGGRGRAVQRDGSGTGAHRIPVESLDQVDDFVAKWLKTAYEADA